MQATGSCKPISFAYICFAVGRKSREVFDDVWTQLQRIGNPARSAQAADRIT